MANIKTTKEFKGTKGVFEVIEHSWSDTSLVCGNKTIATLSIYDEATEDNQEELEREVSANFKLFSKSTELLEKFQILLAMYTNTDKPSQRLILECQQLLKEATELN